jgi:hypothetical protein
VGVLGRAIDVERTAQNAETGILIAVLGLVAVVERAGRNARVVATIGHAVLVGGSQAEVADLAGRAGRLGLVALHALAVVEVGR